MRNRLASMVLVAAMPAALAAAPDAAVDWPAVSAAYQRVTDYTATYEKVERAIDRGELQIIRLSFRKPFDVRMEWLDHGKVDQVAVYRRGLNNGKLRARRSGLLGGLIGVVSLDPHDGLAMADSRHPITEVGIGHLIETLDAALGKAAVKAAPATSESLDGAMVDRIEFVAANAAAFAGIEGAHRVSVWIDGALLLPVRIDILDGQGTLLERHRYRELRVNVGLTDRVFSL